MKRVIVVIMLALCLAGCHNNKKKGAISQADLNDEVIAPENVDWIGLYIRCHELDSIKNVAEAAAASLGQPMETLPDSIPALWDTMLGEMLLQHGDNAFDLFDSHRKDIEDYLRLDFIYYGFITKVYLPYRAMKCTKEEYGVICIDELEKEYAKAEWVFYKTGQAPSHYEHMLMDLFYAYLNYDKNDQALSLCDSILQYLGDTYSEESLGYANMLSNKAHLCGNMGSTYTAIITAKRAIGIYGKILANPSLSQDVIETATKEKKKLEDKLQLWQKK